MSDYWGSQERADTTVLPRSSAAPRVSVIIVNHNAAETLPKTLAALRGDPELEVVVVDNASTDASPLFVEPPHRLIAAYRNLGFAGGSNLGFADTSAPLVLFLNPDAVIVPAAVRHLAVVLESEPDVAAAGPRLVDAEGRPDPHAARRRPGLAALLFQLTGLARRFPDSALFGALFDHGSGSRDVVAVSGSCMMLRRSAATTTAAAASSAAPAAPATLAAPAAPATLAAPAAPATLAAPAAPAATAPMGPFDERFFLGGEDIDLCLRLGRAGWRVRYVDEVACLHVGGHSMGQAVPTSMLEGYRSWVVMLAKDRGRLVGALAWLIAVAVAAAQVPLWAAGAAPFSCSRGLSA